MNGTKKAYVTLIKMLLEYTKLMATCIAMVFFYFFESTEKVYIKFAYGLGSKASLNA